MENNMTRSRGFTLIEIMVVMTIVLLLAVMAYPSYSHFTVKARRIEGQVALLDLMQKQERYFSQHHTYLAFSADSDGPTQTLFKWWSGERALRSAYEMRGQACPGQDLDRCIELHALPGTAKVDSAFVDKHCQTLMLTSVGQHSATGTGQGCWP